MAEQVVSGSREHSVGRRSKGRWAADVEPPTLSAVQLIPPVGAVFLAVAYKEWMQRAAAPTGPNGSGCGKKNKPKKTMLHWCVQGQAARAILTPTCSMFMFQRAYSRRPRHSRPGSRPGRHSADSCPHTDPWSTGSGSPDRLGYTRGLMMNGTEKKACTMKSLFFSAFVCFKIYFCMS